MQKQEEHLGAKYKDEEITNLVKSINDLAGIFKDLSVLVVEQGTVLDRIDHNIECAKEDTTKAAEILEKVYTKEKSKRA
jgi:syntaxin 16